MASAYIKQLISRTPYFHNGLHVPLRNSTLLPLISKHIAPLNLLQKRIFQLPPLKYISQRNAIQKNSGLILENLHIVQYTCPDLIYAVNSLSGHVSDPSPSALQGIKRLIQCLYGCTQCIIMYPTGLVGTATHDLHQEVFPDEYHFQKISNGLVPFLYGVEVCALNQKPAIACFILCIFIIDVHWLAKNQPVSVAHSTYYKVLTLYFATRMVQRLRPILKNLGFQVSDAPTLVYTDSQTTIDAFNSNNIKRRGKHISIPVNYVHEKYF